MTKNTKDSTGSKPMALEKHDKKCSCKTCGGYNNYLRQIGKFSHVFHLTSLIILLFSSKLLSEHRSKYDPLGEDESLRIMEEILAMKIGLRPDQVFITETHTVFTQNIFDNLNNISSPWRATRRPRG